MTKERQVQCIKYGGNENYTGNNTTQKLTIKEKVVEAKPSSSSSTSSNTPRYTTDEYGTYDNELDMYIDRQAKGLSKMNYNIILILKGVMVVEQINLMFDRR